MSNTKIKTMGSRQKNKIIFYCLLLAFPVIQFVIFYIFVNFNAISLSFKKYDSGVYSFAGLENYENILKMITSETSELKYSFINSFKVLIYDAVIIIPLTLFFSFYISKEFFMSKVYKVFLFIPSIISVIVMVLLYEYFLEEALPIIIRKITGAESGELIFEKSNSFLHDFTDTKRAFTCVLIYYIFVSFGTSVILYSGAMSGISMDTVEAANLDGAIGIKEFWYIAIPSVWPTVVVLTLAKLTGFFTNKFNLFSFYGTGAPIEIQTIGYYLFKRTNGSLVSMSDFPELSAMGVVFTLIIAPITILLKYVMEKFGPRED